MIFVVGYESLDQSVMKVTAIIDALRDPDVSKLLDTVTTALNDSFCGFPADNVTLDRAVYFIQGFLIGNDSGVDCEILSATEYANRLLKEKEKRVLH